MGIVMRRTIDDDEDVLSQSTPRDRGSRHADLRPTLDSDALARGNIDLAALLLEKGFHPVLVFGTRAAGKTVLLASLLSYLDDDSVGSKGSWNRGEPIIPTDNAYGREVRDDAKEFLDEKVSDFAEGIVPPSTQNEHPFYIPVIFRPRDGSSDIKFAFLESQGENYQINSTGARLKETKQEVLDLYKNYQEAMSILIITPFTHGTGGDQSYEDKARLETDQGLLGALREYQTYRAKREKDHCLFVLSKWDQYFHQNGGVGSPDFVDWPSELIENEIDIRAHRAWSFFQNMPKGGRMANMPYSAGVIHGNKILKAATFREDFFIFPRTLWNWLYKNATDGAPLYPELERNKVKPSPGVWGWIKSLFTV